MQNPDVAPDTYARLLTQKTVRQFTDEMVSDQHITQILEAGRWTGSAKNMQYWSFIVVSDPVQKTGMLACGDFMTPVENAPLAIALVRDPGGYDFDTGRLAQNMMLAASAIGVGSCPVTMHRDEMAHELFGLPEGYLCRYALALGYPDLESETIARAAQRAYLPTGRKPMSELVHRDRWSG